MISIAICTYNRATSLSKTLASMRELEVDEGLAFELLVVDNNSSDQTSAVVEQSSSSLPIRYLFEPVQGLSAARNRAISEFRGDVLLFTDDDVTVEPGWLTAYAAAIRTCPSASYFGGRILPVYPEGRPRWLRPESEKLALLDGLLVRFHLGESTRVFLPGEPTPFGASFALRRDLIDQVGLFRADLGVSGGVPGRGEEADYLERAVNAGAVGVYVGEAVVNHTTDNARLTFEYLYRFGIQKGIAARRMGSREAGSRVSAALFLIRGVWQAIKGRGDRLRQCVINAGIQIGLRRDRLRSARSE